jgi:hypothetical protein
MKLVTVRAIAICQIIGGGLLFVVNLLALAQQDLPGNPLYLVIYLLTSTAMAGLAVIAGVALWDQSPIGVRLSIIAQVLQLAWISLPHTQFGAILGPLAGFQLSISSFGDVYATVSVGFYGKGGLFLLPADSSVELPMSISINLLAVLALARLWPMLKNQPADVGGMI